MKRTYSQLKDDERRKLEQWRVLDSIHLLDVKLIARRMRTTDVHHKLDASNYPISNYGSGPIVLAWREFEGCRRPGRRERPPLNYGRGQARSNHC
jgi:hypothetical protein